MSVIHYPAVPYERLKRQQLLTLAYVLEEQRDRALKKVEQIPELVAEVERLQGESAHWKSLWKGTVEDSTKVIQERDEALRVVERLEAEIEGLEGMVNTLGGCLNSVAEADKLRRPI